MVDDRLLAAEHGIREGVALADRDGGQVDAVGHVADRVDRVDVGARMLVDDDRAIVAQADARRLEPEAGRIGRATGRDQHLIEIGGGAVGQ